MTTGETVTFPVGYAATDGRPELQGKTIEYTVTLKGVQEKVLPPLDDDLALAVSEFDTLEELTADITSRLEAVAAERVDELFRRMVIDAVSERSSVEVPQVMTDRRIGSILQQTAQQLPENVSFEDYIAATGRTIEQVIEELRPDAEMAVRRELVVEAVAEAEAIEVTDEEMEEQVRQDAEATRPRSGPPDARAARARRVGRAAPGHAAAQGRRPPHRRGHRHPDGAGRGARAPLDPRGRSQEGRGQGHRVRRHGREAGRRGEAVDARRPSMTSTTGTEPLA